MKKRFFSLICFSILLFVCLFGLIACGGDGTKGLEFRVDKENKEAVLVGIGDAEDANVVIPESYKGCVVVEIGEEAFAEDSFIKSVTIPKTIKIINKKAFFNCDSLLSVSFSEECQIEQLKGQIFEGCKELASVKFPNSLEKLGSNMFSGCVKLETITFPENLMDLGYGAFSGCTKLNEIALPSGLKRINAHVFENCSAIEQIAFPEGLEDIGASAFANCRGLTGLTLPQGLVSIGDNAFEYCTNLQVVNLTSENSLNKIGGYAFRSCSKLTEFQIKEGLDIGKGAFSGCSLTNFKMENGLRYLGNAQNPYLYLVEIIKDLVDFSNVQISSRCTEIGQSVFRSAYDLQSITIPASVVTISKDAFSDCWMLKNVYFQSGSKLKKLESTAFAGCEGLSSLSLPSSVEVIESGCFYYSALSSIVINKGIKEIGTIAFQGCPIKSITFKGTKEEWREITLASGWSYNSNLIEISCTDGVILLEE